MLQYWLDSLPWYYEIPAFIAIFLAICIGCIVAFMIIVTLTERLKK